MEWLNLSGWVEGHDVVLLKLGGAVITASSLVKLAVLGTLLWLIAGRFSRWALARLLRHTSMDVGQRAAVSGLVHDLVLVIGAVVILQNAGINLTAFAVVASALGVGVGFGLQNIISNFISGLLIMVEQPIRQGDRIELAGVEGVVHEIGARRTTVVTQDRVAILVPNQRFITDNVTNYVYLDRIVRTRVPVSVAAGSDPRVVERVLLDAAKAHVAVKAEPSPAVTMTTLGASLGFELAVWYDGMACSRQDMLSAIYFEASAALAAQGIKTA